MEKTIVAYYSGAYGPTVYIGVQTVERLILLRDIIANLKSGLVQRVDIHQFESVELLSINTFELTKTNERIYPCIMINGNEKVGVDITWIQHTDELERVVGLLDRLIEMDTPGHQYLVDEENLLIELSYRE